MNPRVRQAHRDFDVTSEAIVRRARAQGVSIPCGRGCDACCFDIAWALDEEADELAERVRSMPTARREGVVERARAWLAGMRAAGLDPDCRAPETPDLRTYHRAHLPCPLLDVEQHQCMAYELRPLSCRGHYVIAPDAQGCANRANVTEVEAVDFHSYGEIQRAVLTIAGQKSFEEMRGRVALLPRALGRRLDPEGSR